MPVLTGTRIRRKTKPPTSLQNDLWLSISFNTFLKKLISDIDHRRRPISIIAVENKTDFSFTCPEIDFQLLI